MRDLVVLVPDTNTEGAVLGALSRPKALGIRPVDFKVVVDQGRDGGVRRRGVQILQVQRNQFSHAVLLFDYEGSGAALPALKLEETLDRELSRDWHDAAKAIVIEPEVDAWMWGAEGHLKLLLGWKFDQGIRAWLAGQSFNFTTSGKPMRPKEALTAVFRRAQVPRSSAHYRRLAGKISLKRCEDPAFRRLSDRLREWFAA